MNTIFVLGSSAAALLSLALVAGCGKDPPAAPGCYPLTGAQAGPGAAAKTDAGAGAAKSDGADDASGGLTVVFPRLYSAYDGAHTFRVPAKVVGASDATWTADPPDAVALGDGADGADVIIEAKAAGRVTIRATSGALWGSAVLTITEASSQDWDRGSARYGTGGPSSAACASCHSEQGMDVEHTPMQLGGYSDDEVAAIFTQAKKPSGAQMRTMPADKWEAIHKWNMDADEMRGLVVYLRSLAPQSHGEQVDWGGR